MEEGAPQTAAPATGKSKMMPLLVIINTLLVAAVLVFVMKKQPAPVAAAPTALPAESAVQAAAPAVQPPGPLIKLESFLVQLRTADSSRYIRLSIDVELKAEGDRDPFVARMAPIRDAVISFLTDRTIEEIQGSEGIARIKNGLMQRLNEITPGRAKSIYVTELIVQ